MFRSDSLLAAVSCAKMLSNCYKDKGERKFKK